MVTLGYGTGHTFVTHDQHAIHPFSLAVLLTLSSCRPPHAHLILSSYCPPRTVHSCCPCTILPTSSSSCHPLCAVLLVSHVSPLMLPSSHHHTVLSRCHCLALSFHLPCAILLFSSRCPPHATICLVLFPHVATPCCLHHTVPNAVHLITTHLSKQLSKHSNALCTWPIHTSVMSNEWSTNIRKLPGLSQFLLPSLFLDLQCGSNRDPSSSDDPSGSITHWCPITEFSVLSLHAVTWSV